MPATAQLPRHAVRRRRSRTRILTTLVVTGGLLAGCGSAGPSVSEGESPTPSTTGSPDVIPTAGASTATFTGDLTGAPGADDWPAYGRDAANSVDNRAETKLGTDNVDQLVKAWRVDSGGVTGTPVVIAGVVYFGDWLGDVYAVDAKSGALAWKQHVTDAPISASAAVSDKLVIVGDLAGGLYALHRSDGTAAWSTTVNTFGASLFASPVVVADMVVIGMTDSELTEPDDPAFRASIVAFGLADGTERWRFFTDPDDSPGLWVTVWSSPAYDPERGLIYVGTGNTNQSGITPENSTENLPLSDGILAIDAKTGTKRWFTKVVPTDKAQDFDVGASPNLFQIGDRDVVAAGAKSGDYVALDRDTGDLVWKQHLTAGSPGGGVMETAAVGDGRIYVASNVGGGNATIFALDATNNGTVLWRQPMEGPVMGGSLALANGVLYRGLFLGPLLALDASNGQELWRSTEYSPLGGGPAVAGGMLYSGYGSATSRHALQALKGGVVAWGLP